ncbi:MAG: thioredoxin domain-containing protein, partial [Verrucomicrobiota bacterium]
DEEGGAFYMTADDSEQLIVRSKKIHGGAIPSGNAVAAVNLARLYRYTLKPNDYRYKELMLEIFNTFGGEIAASPSSVPILLHAVDFHEGPSHEIVISGKADSDEVNAMVHALRTSYLPNKVVILRPEGEEPEIVKFAPLTKGQTSNPGEATAYVCIEGACRLPTTDISKMLELVGANSAAAGSEE